MIKLLTLAAILATLCARSSGFVELQDFIPFGPEHKDTDLASSDHIGNLDDGSSPEQILEEPFQFFRQLHGTLWVNINGAISFNKAIEKYTPYCEALTNDMSMISPFWADVDIRRRGNVYYRQTMDSDVLNKAHADVIKAFPNIGDHDAELGILKWAFVATWLNVPFYDDQFCNANLTNTFQLILTSDGIYSFAIFYYNKIQWTTGTASGSDGCTGFGGRPARAGFDNGKGVMSTLAGSCSKDILEVTNHTLGLTPGKYVFRVDDDKIIVPGSSTLSDITNTATEPSTEPHTGGTGSTGHTGTPPPTTENPEDIIIHKNDTNHKLHDLEIKCAQLCPTLIDHPALQDECFEEWKKLDNLIAELKYTKTEDELGQIDREADKIAMILHQIEIDISFVV